MVCQGALGASWQLWIRSVSLASLWRSLETWTQPWPSTSSMMVAMPSFPPWRWEKEMSYRNLWVNNRVMLIFRVQQCLHPPPCELHLEPPAPHTGFREALDPSHPHCHLEIHLCVHQRRSWRTALWWIMVRIGESLWSSFWSLEIENIGIF